MKKQDFEKDEEDILTQEIIREQSASSVINNAEFQKAFLGYKADLFNTLSLTKWDERDKREEIYRQLKSLDCVESKLIKVISTGRMATQQLTAIQKAKQIFNNVIG